MHEPILTTFVTLKFRKFWSFLDSSANPHSRVRRQGISPSEKGFYGSWDWFIDRIQKDSGITTTKRTTTTAPPTSNNFFQRSLRTGNSGFSSGNSRLAQTENENSYSFKGGKGKQVLGEDIPWFQANQKPEKKFQQLLSDVGKVQNLSDYQQPLSRFLIIENRNWTNNRPSFQSADLSERRIFFKQPIFN